MHLLHIILAGDAKRARQGAYRRGNQQEKVAPEASLDADAERAAWHILCLSISPAPRGEDNAADAPYRLRFARPDSRRDR